MNGAESVFTSHVLEVLEAAIPKGGGRNRRGEASRMTEDAACLTLENCVSF